VERKGKPSSHDRRQIPHSASSFEDASLGYDNEKTADSITWAVTSLKVLLNNLGGLMLAGHVTWALTYLVYLRSGYAMSSGSL
jgi:hypothetical protein